MRGQEMAVPENDLILMCTCNSDEHYTFQNQEEKRRNELGYLGCTDSPT